MRRFLMVLALVAAAGVTYVATATGGQQAGPTAKQFATLKKQVTKLQKQVKTAQIDASASLGFVVTCVAHLPVGVDSVGTSTDGYLFGAPGVIANEATSALTLAPSTEASPQYRVFVVNASNAGCLRFVNSAASLTAVRHLRAFGR